MNEQLSIYDFAEPEYNGSRDEIVRLYAESKLENRIRLISCCGCVPEVRFKSSNEYYVCCRKCGKQTALMKKAYLAMQAWNRMDGGE